MPTRRFMVPVLVLASAIACGDDAPTMEEATTSGTSTTTATPSTGEEDCTPGYEGCVCAEGDLCLDGLSCFSQLCVDAGQASETTTDAEGSTTSALTAEGSSSSTTDATTSGDSSSSGESSTTAVEPECLEGDNYCADAEIQTCVEGLWQEQTCEDHCLAIGYHSPGCASADACACEDFADQPCADGSLGLCYCAELDFGIPCTQEQWTEFYDECIAGVDYAVCFIDYPWLGEPIDCAAAEAACL